MEVSIFGHAFNGGMLIDEWGRSSVPGLYAAGEAAAGPHGADRLGGNMLMTSQVFGHRAGQAAAREALAAKAPDLDGAALDREEKRLAALPRPGGRYRLNDLLGRLQRRMWTVSIVRDERSLGRCSDEVAEGEAALATVRVADPDDVWRALELENLLLVARLVTTAALARRESRGSHYRADFPAPDGAGWGRSLVLRRADGRLEQRLATL